VAPVYNGVMVATAVLVLLIGNLPAVETGLHAYVGRDLTCSC
jgi:hypothetical protein